MTEHKVGLIGWPVEHSLSPVMHNAAFTALGMHDWRYDAMAIPPDIARYGALEPKRHGYVGINVTVPFKEMALEFARPDERARAIGAVNTIDFRTDMATNTDVDGFIDDLKAHGVMLQDQRVIVLGAGGAARAAVYGLIHAGASVTVVNRTMTRAHELVEHLRRAARIETVAATTLDEAAEMDAALIVNCTSAGMWPHVDALPWIPGVPFPVGITVYDMVYRPAETALMKLAVAHKGRAIGGLGMLVRQGAAAFKIWTGRDAPVDVMMDAARQALAKRDT